jgi:hypothetical protein
MRRQQASRLAEMPEPVRSHRWSARCFDILAAYTYTRLWREQDLAIRRSLGLWKSDTNSMSPSLSTIYFLLQSVMAILVATGSCSRKLSGRNATGPHLICAFANNFHLFGNLQDETSSGRERPAWREARMLRLHPEATFLDQAYGNELLRTLRI